MDSTKNKTFPKGSLGRLLPGEVSGWSAPDSDGEYDKDSLFDLIDGGAEVYRSLNVKKVRNRVYSKQGDADIFVDIFDMGSSEDAFGAYHHDIREEIDPGIGQESEYQGGSLYFWRHRYFVSIVALNESDSTKAAVIDLGKGISDAIKKDGPIPKVVALLPERGLLREHLYFFHDAETLDRRYFVGSGNPLDLSGNTDGILGRYRRTEGQDTEETALFLIVKYSKKSHAIAARKALFESLYKRPEIDGPFERDDNRWAGAKVRKRVLFVTLEASQITITRNLLEEAGKPSKK